MGHALENTIESVEKAIDLKVDGIEIDVFKSKSGELIVYHDPSLSRLSNSTAFIEQISLDSIKKIELIGGLSIPTLNEVIDIIPEKIFLNIELKGENTAYETNKIIIKYLSESNLTSSKFIISSFRWDELKKFRNVNKDVPIAILVDSLYKIDNAIKLAKEINAVALNPNNKFITKEIVKKIQSNNIKVYPYTINTPKNINRMKSMGVDAIITDFPERINNIKPNEYNNLTMKKIYLILCILGIALPYYNLFNFLKINNWSMDGFFSLLYENYAVSMLSMDLTVAASSFLIFLIYSYRKSPTKIIRYLLPMFLVGFSLALPLYLYDNHKSN